MGQAGSGYEGADGHGRDDASGRAGRRGSAVAAHRPPRPEIQIETLRDDRRLRVWRHRGQSNRLVVCFSGVGRDWRVPPRLELAKTACAAGRDHALYFADPARSWLNAPLLAEEIAGLIEAEVARTGATQVVALGHSLGAFRRWSFRASRGLTWCWRCHRRCRSTPRWCRMNVAGPRCARGFPPSASALRPIIWRAPRSIMCCSAPPRVRRRSAACCARRRMCNALICRASAMIPSCGFIRPVCWMRWCSWPSPGARAVCVSCCATV
ncbi:hypothetical protein ACFSHQ_22975 [Gemmobacter lanyuensis]